MGFARFSDGERGRLARAWDTAVMKLPVSMCISVDTPLHRLHAGVKIVVLFVFTAAVFLVETVQGMTVACAAVACMLALGRLSARLVAQLLAPVLALAAFTLAVSVVQAPGVVSGLGAGMLVAARMIALVAASFAVCLSSEPLELVAAFRALLSPARRLGVPVDDIAVTLALALRFIPVAFVELARIRDAQASRASCLDAGLPHRRLIAWSRVFVPLFVGLFRRAGTLADAMNARCYGAVPMRTQLVSHPLRPADIAAGTGAVCLCAALAIAL